MRKYFAFLFFTIFIVSCNHNSSGPNVSSIKMDIPLERYDVDFFNIDTNNIAAGLSKVRQAHPDFHKDFMQQILGVPDSDSSTQTLTAVKMFLSGYRQIENSLQQTYKNTDWLKKELDNAFRYVKYYFPNYKAGKVVLFTGPFDAPGVATTNFGLAVGLQQFAGANFDVYQTPTFQEIFPSYISRRFSKEYIVPNCMKAISDDIFPDKSNSLPLIEQMVEKGKRWYLLDKLLPNTPDSLKTGYTQQQLNWCKDSEGLLWSYLAKNEDLNSVNPSVLQIYIGESPYTQGLSPEYSPGNIGQWIGWQIVKKFVGKNSDLSVDKVMQTPAREFIEQAKYKPK